MSSVKPGARLLVGASVGALSIAILVSAMPAQAADAPAPSASPTGAATPAPTPAATPAPTGTPGVTPSDSAAPIAPPVVMPTALGSWCRAMFPSAPAAERVAAQNLLTQGTINFGKGGTYRLTEHPDWKPQATSDTSGDRHVNSLNWALPLLFRGVQVQNQAMVDRFRQLMLYWIADHQGPRGTWVDGTIYGGLRTQTLVCAAQTLNDPTITEAALRDARTMVKSNAGAVPVAVGVNNTDLIRQTGALAAFCWTADWPSRDRAWANLVSIANGVVLPDGSDVEGSPAYAVYIESLLRTIETSATTCGMPADPIPTLRNRLYDFVSQAIRPDFLVESLGDSVSESLRASFGAADGQAEWVRTAGKSGTPPAPIYATFDGGYVFGRAGWQPQLGGPDTFYSLRYSSTRPATAHTHDDGTGLTLFSRGTSWIGDPGPYRYENSDKLRAYLKTRAAHSALTVGKVARSRWSGVKKVITQSDWATGGNDTSCVQDNTWVSVTLVRCTQYVRSVDAMIVTDYVNAAPGKGKKAKGRFTWQRWQVAPGVESGYIGSTLVLTKGNQHMDVVKAGTDQWVIDKARNGSSVGWYTGAWGQKLPTQVINRQIAIPKTGMQQALVTVFVPRTGEEQVPVTIGPDGVTITRGALTITTPAPMPQLGAPLL
ncbi:MAG: heparinase II/III family protein [Candidatus Nanopelagicales bacterium]|nr:heparinase II/III family protein [Candidatus Nanopelagicales bacterium]